MAERLPIYEIETEIIAAEGDETPRAASAYRLRQIHASAADAAQARTAREGQVVILQPRRLAARLLATRVARELGWNLDAKSVIRSDSKMRPATPRASSSRPKAFCCAI